MSFRYDMQGKDSQAQAIVRNREKREKLREEERERQAEIRWEKFTVNGSYQSVICTKNNDILFELRVSLPAIQNGDSNLQNEDIHLWLSKIGSGFIKQVKKCEILIISASDVVDKELVTDWKNLKREKAAE